MNARGQAIRNAISGVKDFIGGIGASKMTVDNSKNPASAYSMMKRKTESMGQPKNFDNTFQVGKKAVPYRNDQQKNGPY